MREALEQVKRDLGPDAVIMSTRTIPARLPGARPRVEVSAAPGRQIPLPRREGAGGGFVSAPSRAKSRLGREPEKEAGRGRKPPAPPVAPHLYPYYVHLVQSEVAENLAAQLVRQAAAQVPQGSGSQPDALRQALRECIARLLPATGGLDPKAPRRVALVGPPGGGKTTTLAKLAAHFKLREARTVGVLSLDTHRPGATEQLQRYADILGLQLHAAQTLAQVKQAIKDIGPVDVLLIDTPGVGLREQGRFARLASLLRAAHPDETHLVLPVSLTPEVQLRVAQSLAPLGISRVVLTRLDEAIGCGVILNIAQRLNLGVSYITTGQNVPRDIEAAGGQRVAELLGLAAT
jgi:flagellar biosynthesis protein FlhF